MLMESFVVRIVCLLQLPSTGDAGMQWILEIRNWTAKHKTLYWHCHPLVQRNWTPMWRLWTSYAVVCFDWRLNNRAKEVSSDCLINKQQSYLMKKTEQSAIAYFDSKRVSMNDISRLLFMESLKNTRIAKKLASWCVWHSPVMVCFCVGLKNQKLKSEWNISQKWFNELFFCNTVLSSSLQDSISIENSSLCCSHKDWAKSWLNCFHNVRQLSFF
jgi:hypothetical protein